MRSYKTLDLNTSVPRYTSNTIHLLRTFIFDLVSVDNYNRTIKYLIRSLCVYNTVYYNMYLPIVGHLINIYAFWRKTFIPPRSLRSTVNAVYIHSTYIHTIWRLYFLGYSGILYRKSRDGWEMTRRPRRKWQHSDEAVYTVGWRCNRGAGRKTVGH